jgi:hypothetical protein
LFCAGSLPDCHFVDAKYAPSVESLVAASPIEKSVELSALIQRPAPPFIAGAEGKKWRVSHRATPSALLCRGLMMFAFCDNLKVRGLFFDSLSVTRTAPSDRMSEAVRREVAGRPGNDPE